MGVGLDAKNPERYLVGLSVGGLGLPDKDYYLNPDARFVAIRAAYVTHIQKMLGFTGVSDGKARAEAILALETALAGKLWDRADLRDRDKTYNLTKFSDLASKYPGYDWAAHCARRWACSTPEEVNVSTPSAVGPVLAIVNGTPLPIWRDYLSFHAVEQQRRPAEQGDRRRRVCVQRHGAQRPEGAARPVEARRRPGQRHAGLW